MLGSLLRDVADPKGETSWVNGWQKLTSGVVQS